MQLDEKHQKKSFFNNFKFFIMSMKIQIQSVHFDADQSLKSFINKKLTKLETFYDKIIDSDVVLSLEQLNTQVRDKVVVIKTNIPGSTIIAKEKSKKFEEAIDLAVESLKKQLVKIKTKYKE
ncbi:MAG: ribosome-associated translation inhibitor RaiA [Chitinophagales bacterium]|jgi:putative sigma-54 modulation protein|nr:ribosome-associated translation inhibitor RaiA [Chitinophagales bacterium]